MRKFEDPRLVGENRLPQRAYYIPYATREKALAGDLATNERYLSLDGEWDFGYFESYEDRDPTALGDKIKVPSCWQTVGYGTPQYLNVNYPFAFTPRASISATSVWAASCCDLYVNATSAPSAANFRAIALPMPLVAPVTSAVFPVKSFMIMSIFLQIYPSLSFLQKTFHPRGA